MEISTIIASLVVAGVLAYSMGVNVRGSDRVTALMYLFAFLGVLFLLGDTLALTRGTGIDAERGFKLFAFASGGVFLLKLLYDAVSEAT